MTEQLFTIPYPMSAWQDPGEFRQPNGVEMLLARPIPWSVVSAVMDRFLSPTTTTTPPRTTVPPGSVSSLYEAYLFLKRLQQVHRGRRKTMVLSLSDDTGQGCDVIHLFLAMLHVYQDGLTQTEPKDLPTLVLAPSVNDVTLLIHFAALHGGSSSRV